MGTANVHLPPNPVLHGASEHTPGNVAPSQSVKPFKQRELHGTVTICAELQIANQQVTLK
jgi:hypothetical protein